MKSLLSICLFILLLASCGQKGPLFLPSDPSKQRELQDYTKRQEQSDASGDANQ